MFLRSFTRSTSLQFALAFALFSGAPGTAVADLSFSAFRQTLAEAVAGDADLASFYRSNQFDGLWTGSDPAAQARRNALLAVLSEADQHGLPRDAYDVDRVVARMRSAQTPTSQAAMDVELTQLLITYAQDVHSGVLDPSRVLSAIKRDAPQLDARTVLTDFFEADAPLAYLRSLAPQSPEYTRLMRQRASLMGLIETGGWGPSMATATVSPGDEGPAVVALRNRLIAMGYLERSVTQRYDASLTEAVRTAQTAFGIETDGVAGATTIAALNVSAATRLEQVLVAMERERWMMRDRGTRHIWVNLTDFYATVIDDERETYRTRAVIGAREDGRETPEFSDIMDHMVINPTWYVPRSITVNEYLPGLRRNAGAHGQLDIVDRRGRVVNRGEINFAQYTSSNFPYSMRQPPSPSNALGRVKFMFPNQWNIYLHDTPAQSLFAREVRAFSHGCIRLDDPYDFAYHLLAAQEGDPVGFFQARLRSGNETRVNLVQPVPVHLVYRTAFTNVQGELQFRRDIYGRDARIWRALSAAGVVIGGVQG